MYYEIRVQLNGRFYFTTVVEKINTQEEACIFHADFCHRFSNDDGFLVELVEKDMPVQDPGRVIRSNIFIM